MTELERASAARSIADEAPWKKLGRAWHEDRRGFPEGAKIAWPTEVAVLVMDTLERTFPETTWSFEEADCARMTLPDLGTISVYTKRPKGVELEYRSLERRVRSGSPDSPEKPKKSAKRLGSRDFSLRFTSVNHVLPLLTVMLQLLTSGSLR